MMRPAERLYLVAAALVPAQSARAGTGARNLNRAVATARAFGKIAMIDLTAHFYVAFPIKNIRLWP